jgi:hypothetical protein
MEACGDSALSHFCPTVALSSNRTLQHTGDKVSTEQWLQQGYFGGLHMQLENELIISLKSK